MNSVSNPILSGRVGIGKFNFPTPSLPKGEGGGELNFSRYIPHYSLDFWNGTLEDFDNFLWRIWRQVLDKNNEFYSDGWTKEEGDYILKKFREKAGIWLFEHGIYYWFPQINSIFCAFARMRRLEDLRYRKSRKNGIFNVYFEEKKIFFK